MRGSVAGVVRVGAAALVALRRLVGLGQLRTTLLTTALGAALRRLPRHPALVPALTHALAGTLLALLLTLGLTWVFFAVVHFSGLGTEEALTLPSVSCKATRPPKRMRVPSGDGR